MALINIRGFARQFSKLLRPAQHISGLEITESSVRFLLVEGPEDVVTVSLRLPPGVIEKGRIKDAQTFVATLKGVRAKISSSRNPVPVILLLPPESVYIQSFMLPSLEGKQLEEAARLNLEVISPIDFKNAYSGWQEIGEGDKDKDKLELLAAFSERGLVDEFSNLISRAGFSIAAVEFPALAVARVVKELGKEVIPTEPYLVVRITSEGVEMMILNNLNLYFHEFTPWYTLQEESGAKKIALKNLNSFLGREIQRILNFYSSHWGGTLGNAILITQNFEEEVSQFLRSTFTLSVRPLSLTTFGRLPALWYPVLGAARRGLIPRSADTYISLTSTSVSTQYQEEQLFSFIGLWRNIFVTLLLFFLVALLGVDSFVARRVFSFQEELSSQQLSRELQEVMTLEAQSKEFNRLVSLALTANKESRPVSSLLIKIDSLAGPRITFRNMTLSREIVAIVGVADDQAVATAFKNKLEREADFTDVDLPPSSFRFTTDDKVTFTITFKIVLDSSS